MKSLAYAPDTRCPICSALDLDAIFDPCQFSDLPGTNAPGDVPWTRYIRKITTYTADHLQTYRDSCSICFFLDAVASIARKYPFEANLVLPLASKGQNGTYDARADDANCFTLAATSSRFLRETAGDPVRSLVTRQGFSGAGINGAETDGTEPNGEIDGEEMSDTETIVAELDGAELHDDLEMINGEKISKVATNGGETNGTSAAPGTSVWLTLLKGGQSLERMASRVQQFLTPAQIPQFMLGQLRIYGKNTGTHVMEVIEDLLSGDASLKGRIVIPDMINYDQLQSWLRSCSDLHPHCSRSARVPVPHMKLVDCATRTLVPATPNMPYAALSYVWGAGGAPEKYTYPNLPLYLPMTVEDAITATLRLGIPYLWIDRYCIWQDDPAHKMSQILHMTHIYRNAAVTLAAAAGADPHYGLPGVSSRGRIRNSQMIGRAGTRILVSGAIHRRQGEAIQRSAWDTRAWTYQEATLSPRILFFSDNEVSFLCAEVEWFEHLSRPLLLTDLATAVGRRYTYHTGLGSPEGARTLIQTYSKRKMSLKSDALNAVLGVLGAWSAANANCYHYWGVPLWFPRPVEECSDLELSVMLWSGLCWSLDLSNAGKRRDGFPSWSWLAVEGRIRLGRFGEKTIVSRPGRANLAVRAGDDRVVCWSDFVRAGGLSLAPLSWRQSLYVQGLVFKIGSYRRPSASVKRMPYLYVPLPGNGDISDLEGKSSREILLVESDFGTSTAESAFSTREFEAVAAYATDREGFAIIFERSSPAGGSRDCGRRVGLLNLAVHTLSVSDWHQSVPLRVCDAEKTFGARWDTICLH